MVDRVEKAWPGLPWQGPRKEVAGDPNCYGRLYMGDTLLGTLLAVGADFPRRYFEFAPAETYESVRAIFEDAERDRDVPRLLARCEVLDLRILWRRGAGPGKVRTHRIRSLWILGGDKAVLRSGLASFPDGRQEITEDDDPDPGWSSL